MAEIRVSRELQGFYSGFYEEGASEWRRLGAIGKADNVISLCSPFRHDSVIEVGAGEGSVIARLSEMGFGKELFAIDISQSGVDAIKSKGIPRLLECRLFDGYHIPYVDDRFDLAVLSHVVEHVEFPRQLIYEASRVAKYVFIEVPLDDTIRMPFNYIDDGVGHINPHSRKTLRRLAQTSNLRVLRQIAVDRPKETFTYKNGRRGVPTYHIRRALLKIAPAAATALFTYHGAIVCEKVPRQS